MALITPEDTPEEILAAKEREEWDKEARMKEQEEQAGMHQTRREPSC